MDVLDHLTVTVFTAHGWFVVALYEDGCEVVEDVRVDPATPARDPG